MILIFTLITISNQQDHRAVAVVLALGDQPFNQIKMEVVANLQVFSMIFLVFMKIPINQGKVLPKASLLEGMMAFQTTSKAKKVQGGTKLIQILPLKRLQRRTRTKN